jgi:hypothetical protein
MEDCKPMATPMIINLKKVAAGDSELVNPTLYRSLIVFNNTNLLYGSVRMYGSVVRMAALTPLLFFSSAQLVFVSVRQKLCLNSLS